MPPVPPVATDSARKPFATGAPVGVGEERETDGVYAVPQGDMESPCRIPRHRLYFAGGGVLRPARSPQVVRRNGLKRHPHDPLDIGGPRGAGPSGSVGEFLQLYHRAMVTHLVWSGRWKPEDAEDVVQSFVVDKICTCNVIAAADRAGKRFRNFLLTVLDRYGQARRRAAGRSANRITPGNSRSRMTPRRRRHPWAALRCSGARPARPLRPADGRRVPGFRPAPGLRSVPPSRA